MYISSYNTYITPNSSDRVQKERTEEPFKKSQSFSKQLASQSLKTIDTSSTLPVNYISNYKVLNNQLRLKDDTFNDNRAKFSKVKALVNSQSAYKESASIFPLLTKPKIALSQTQEAKETILKHTMVNTYIANDNYYKLTA